MRVSDISHARRAFSLLLALLALAAPLRAATPRDELLRLVPDSIGFCFVMQDVREHAAALNASPFVQQLRLSPLVARLRKSEDVKKFEHFQAALKAKLGFDLAQLRDDILGDGVVFAYRPGPAGKPEQEQGLILVRARNARVLADLIERLNKVQKEEGELKELEERRHNDVVYQRRVERDKPPTFYYVHGPVLALSGQEDMLRQAIDCDRLRAADAVPFVTSRLRELDAERALLAVWINPRTFDAEVESKTGTAPAERAAGLKQFASYWKALDSVVLALTPGERALNLSLGLRARVAEMPPAARQLFAAASTPSDLWRRFPESALLAVAGRIDLAALLDVFDGFLTPEARQTLHADLNRQFGALLGGDVRKEVLPALGPDGGLCLTAPASGDRGWMPHSLLALRVAPTGDTAPLDRTLPSALDFAARLIVLGHNRRHPDRPLTLKTTEVNKQEVRYLASANGLPEGVQPASTVGHGYLVLSSSLDALRRFLQTPPSAALATDAPVPLVRISVKDWRSYLKDRREPVTQFLASKNRLGAEAAAGQLDQFLANLQFLDRLELSQRSAPGQVIFTLTVQTTQALRK